MKSLAELQRSFCDALRWPGNPPAALLGELLDDGQALQRFNVYRNNFIVLNSEALADMYPVVQRLVGAPAFQQLARAYVREFPPLHRTLLLYGDRFADFLGALPELSGLPYLPDVARLEYAWTQSYHAADAAPLSRSELDRIEPEALSRLHLVPHPSLHCMQSEYPVLRIWQSNASPGDEETVSLDEGGCRLLLLRPQLDVEIRSAGPGDFSLLVNLQQGKSLAAAYEAAVQAAPDFDLTDYLSRHLLDGTFVAIRRPEEAVAVGVA